MSEVRLKEEITDGSEEELLAGLVKAITAWIKEDRQIVLIGAYTGDRAKNTSIDDPLIRTAMTAPVNTALSIINATQQMITDNLYKMEEMVNEALGKETPTTVIDEVSGKEVSIAEPLHMMGENPFSNAHMLLGELENDMRSFVLVYQRKDGRIALQSNSPFEVYSKVLAVASKEFEKRGPPKA